MKYTERAFNYGDLQFDLQGLKGALGFPGADLPEPFDSYVEEALEFASQTSEIKVGYLICDDVKLDRANGSVHVNDFSLNIGKTICKELRGAEKLLFFVCTAGPSISMQSSELLKGEDPAKGYIYDQVGTYLVEAAGDRMQQLIKEDLKLAGNGITNRYSPGYCHWSVSDQHKLFSLFPAAPCGVTLTGSALMHPVKSISGLIGVGREVKYREYQCSLCLSLDCIYRKIHDGQPGRH